MERRKEENVRFSFSFFFLIVEVSANFAVCVVWVLCRVNCAEPPNLSMFPAAHHLFQLLSQRTQNVRLAVVFNV